MTETSARDPLLGSLLDDRYRIQRRLARGGMSTVYVATDTKLRRQVAIKVLYPHLAEDPALVERFEAEAIAAAKLSDPHVVSVYDQGVDDETAYLVLEYVPGATLRDILKTQGRLSPRVSIEIVSAVLAGLRAAHAAGLVHRDVKPENVLLSPDGRIKVADFGLARAATSHTATGAGLVGTVAYISPELVKGEPADTRSDLYALGVMFYEMLTGQQPFTGDVAWNVAMAHVSEQVPPPSDAVPGIAADLDDLVRWSTEHNPDDRPHDAGSLLEETQHIASTLTDWQLDLGEEPARARDLLAATLAVLERTRPAEPSARAQSPSPTAPPNATELAGAPERPERQPASQASPGPASPADEAAGFASADHTEAAAAPDLADPTDPEASTSATGPAAIPAAAVSPDEAATQALASLPTSVLPGTQTQPPASYAAQAPTAALPGPATAPLSAESALPTQALPGVAPADPSGVSPTEAFPAPSAALPEDALVPRLADQAPQHQTVDVAPVSGRSRRAAQKAERAAEKQRRKDAQRPTESLKRPGSARRGWLWAIIIVIVAALVGIGTWYVGAGPGAEAVIPDLRTASVEQARAELAEQGFSKVGETEVFDDTVPAGAVVSTDPPQGGKQRKFNTVQLLVSKGPELFVVPNLVKQTQADAKAALEDQNLSLGKVTQEFDESIAKGQVISQGVKAGSEQRRGTSVSVVISKGQAPIKVPSVAGKDPDYADSLLDGLGLKAARGDDVFSDSVASGSIVSQTPEAGSELAKGGTVTYQVSKGPEMVDVPNVYGKSTEDATAILEAAGFTVKVEQGGLLGSVFNKVVGQTPSNGQARKGSEVTITIY